MNAIESLCLIISLGLRLATEGEIGGKASRWWMLDKSIKPTTGTEGAWSSAIHVLIRLLGVALFDKLLMWGVLRYLSTTGEIASGAI